MPLAPEDEKDLRLAADLMSSARDTVAEIKEDDTVDDDLCDSTGTHLADATAAIGRVLARHGLPVPPALAPIPPSVYQI